MQTIHYVLQQNLNVLRFRQGATNYNIFLKHKIYLKISIQNYLMIRSKYFSCLIITTLESHSLQI